MTASASPGLLATAALIAVAAACGAGLRFLAERRWGPRGVLAANAAASLLAGAAAGLGGGLAVLGAFTLALGTFSTVAADGAAELLDGRLGAAVRRWAVHLGCGTVTATLGWWAGSAVAG